MKRASIAEITLTQQAKQEQFQIDKIDIEINESITRRLAAGYPWAEVQFFPSIFLSFYIQPDQPT